MRRIIKQVISESKAQAKNNRRLADAALAELNALKKQIIDYKAELSAILPALNEQKELVKKAKLTLGDVNEEIAVAEKAEKAQAKKLAKLMGEQKKAEESIRLLLLEEEAVYEDTQTSFTLHINKLAEQTEQAEARNMKRLEEVGVRIQREEGKLERVKIEVRDVKKQVKDLTSKLAILEKRKEEYSSLESLLEATKKEMVAFSIKREDAKKAAKVAEKEAIEAEKNLAAFTSQVGEVQREVISQKAQLLSLSTRESTLERREKHLVDKCEKFGLRVTDL